MNNLIRNIYIGVLEKVFSRFNSNSSGGNSPDDQDEIVDYIKYLALIDGLILQLEQEKHKNGWRKYHIPKMITNLLEYKEELNNKLEDPSNNFIYIDETLLVKNSFFGMHYSEIFHLLPQLTYKEMIELKTGKLNLEKLKLALPNKISSLKKYSSNYIKNSSRYSEFYPIIEEALKTYELKLIKAANLLVVTCIEGMVRKLAGFLKQEQNLTINLEPGNYNSLASLLREDFWKEDLQTESYIVRMLDTPENFRMRNEYSGVKSHEKFMDISIKIRLGYLRKRFKDNRDLMLHGQNTEYDNITNTFFNFGSLNDIISVLIQYDDKYRNNTVYTH